MCFGEINPLRAAIISVKVLSFWDIVLHLLIRN